MSIENVRLFRTVEKVRKDSSDILESIGKGFAFPVHRKIREMDPNEVVKTSREDTTGINKVELFKTVLEALQAAWEEAIEPQIEKIRAQSPTSMKRGVDFFTKADTDSEELIRQRLLEKFGKDKIRVFGEEADAYKGNPSSRIGVRIDPIDGTESFKFSKPDWGIMVGIYEGEIGSEVQIAGAVYYPERNMLAYSVKDIGVFLSNVELGETQEIASLEDQDQLGNIIIETWKHSDVNQRGDIQGIERELAKNGARIRSTASSCGDVLEALLTKGQRAMIMDGDFNEPDFIPYAFLVELGYEIYDWKGNLQLVDDPGLKNKKLVVVPPGQAKEQILSIIKKHT